MSKRIVLYSAEQTPPKGILIFSSLQQVLVVLALGFAVPVTIARSIGLSIDDTTSYISVTFFSMGIITILQSIKSTYLGSGLQSFSVSESAAIAACIMAGQKGGLPLIFGMIIFTGILRFAICPFMYYLRRLLSTEVTGSMIFILGIAILPSAGKYFLGSPSFAATGQIPTVHIIVAICTFLFLVGISIFSKKWKAYSILIGTVFGFALSWATGLFHIESFSSIADNPWIAIPFRRDFSFSFDTSMIIPFLVVAITGVLDNISDYTASQNVNDVQYKKADWKSIVNGARATSLGIILSGLLGGAMQSTATSNIGIAKASGITSRKVAYLGGGFLIILSFFPRIIGVFALIPEPVLGAIMMMCVCYILSSGFSSLNTINMDEKRIFLVWASVAFAISTFIPGLYDFMSPKVANVLLSPMSMGFVVLTVINLFVQIANKKTYRFSSAVSLSDRPELDENLDNIAKDWGLPKRSSDKLKIGIHALCEGFYDLNKDCVLHFEIYYNEFQVKMKVETSDVKEDISDTALQNDDTSTLGVTFMMLNHMFEKVKTTSNSHETSILVEEEIE